MTKLYTLGIFYLLVCLFPASSFARNNVAPVPNSSLVFIENKGQITDQSHKTRPDIDFKLNAPGIDIFIGDAQVHYQWTKTIDSISAEIYRLDVSLVGANRNAEIITENKQEYHENYYLPQCPDGVTAGSCKKITYRNIYPNIDWVLYITGNHLKYDFVVHNGGNAKNIKLKYAGAATMRLMDGALQVTTPFGSLTENAPYSYDAETKEKIPSKYILTENTLSFDIAATNRSIVIDPQIDWATYYGGSGDEINIFTFSLYTGTSIFYAGFYRMLAVNSLGEPIFCGSTSGSANMATIGSYQQTFGGNTDAFVAKFSIIGQCIWATYYGGAAYDMAFGIEYDLSGDCYLYGCTNSLGMATTGSHQLNLDTTIGYTPGANYSGTDGFIAKFNNTGLRIWATYFGGENNDGIQSISFDANNNLYISGTTLSFNNIATSGSYQNVKGYASGFLTKFSPSGVRQWGTYFGEDNTIHSTLAASNGIDAIFIGGSMFANVGAKNISTAGSHQEKPARDYWEGYLARFDTNGKIQWATYIGGKDFDWIATIECDNGGNIYLGGQTNSDTGIATQGTHQVFRNAGTNGLLMKFDATGKRLWGSYFGGNALESQIEGIDVDGNGDLNIVGLTSSNAGIATTGAWKINKSDSIDAFYVKFDGNGKRLWGTYYGGEKYDRLMSVASDKSKNVYLVGITTSLTGIATIGSHQPVYGGGLHDAFLLKSTPDSIVYLEQPFNDTVICLNSTGASIQVGYIVTRSFRTGNIFTVQLSDATGSFANAVNIGSYTGTASGYVQCQIPASMPDGNGYRIRVVSSAPFYISTDNGKNIRLMRGPEKPVASDDTAICEGDNLYLYSTCPTPNVGYIWIGPNNFVSFLQNPVIFSAGLIATGAYIVTVTPQICRMKDTVIVLVKPLPGQPTIIHNAPLCEGTKLNLKPPADTGTIKYTWRKPSDSTIVADSIIIPVVKGSDEGKYVVVAERKGCINLDSTEIIVKRKPILKTSSNSPLQMGKDLYLHADIDSGTAEYSWNGPNGYSANQPHPIRYNVLKDAAGTYNITVTRDGCSTIGQVLVVIDDAGEPGDFLELNPNPNHGNLTLRGQLRTDQSMPLTIMNSLGQIIYTDIVRTNNKILDTQITMPDVAAGAYYLRIMVSGKRKSFRFVVSK